jgi:phosphoribosyl-dephospho-CoA transferase
MLRRHDLVQVELAAWDAMLRCHPALLDLPLVPDWARRGWPVIVRRRMEGDCVDGVPAALPLPPCHGKRRLAFSFSTGAAVTALPPVLLCDAARSAPVKWQPIISALLDLGETIKIPPRVFGALTSMSPSAIASGTSCGLGRYRPRRSPQSPCRAIA